MKKQCTKILIMGILQAVIMLLAAYYQKSSASTQYLDTTSKVNDEVLKSEAFKILDAKCNVCHRKQNPFMVFKKKNMEKRAPKIYEMVYVEKKMPKGDKVRLTNQEYAKLKKWLSTQNIY